MMGQLFDMRVLILGFDTKEEIDKEMEKLIESTQCFLFSVVCGSADCASANWAQWRGAPIVFSQAKNPQGLLKEADYLVIRLTSDTPQWIKNLIMEWKAEGKHGTVIR